MVKTLPSNEEDRFNPWSESLNPICLMARKLNIKQKHCCKNFNTDLKKIFKIRKLGKKIPP